MAPTPGLLWVTMQPGNDLPAAQFHEWYNNEHGPTRLRLPYIKTGLRYRTTDASKPRYLAIYDVDDVQMFNHHSYTSLRDSSVKSTRETRTMAKIAIDRRIYELVSLKEKSPREKCSKVILVGIAVADNKPESDHPLDSDLARMQNEPNWLRTRIFKTSSLDQQHDSELLVLYEFEKAPSDNKEPLFDAHCLDKLLVRPSRGPWVWERFYTFGPAPRDLESLSDETAESFISNDGRTKTPKSPRPAIESYVTMKDGAILPYRLEGAAPSTAPLLVLVNSILVDWGIWDGFVDSILDHTQSYRVLRYNARGRSKDFGTAAVTLEVLVSDLLELLDALHVQDVAMAVGVSLGGATVLSAALHHPDRIPKFLACDTNARAPESNPKAWDDRVAVAEKEGATSAGRSIVGEELAEMTTRRWFVDSSYDGGIMEDKIQRTKRMVRDNDLDGFRMAVRALYRYDMKALLPDAASKGGFLVGGGDGKLPETMQEMADQYGKGAKLEIIPEAGHLPMVEKPQAVAGIVLHALNS